MEENALDLFVKIAKELGADVHNGDGNIYVAGKAITAEELFRNSQGTCETCANYPPSSCDGKPCCICEPADPMLNCYEPKS